MLGDNPTIPKKVSIIQVAQAGVTLADLIGIPETAIPICRDVRSQVIVLYCILERLTGRPKTRLVVAIPSRAML
jgi:hypothetical protein